MDQTNNLECAKVQLQEKISDTQRAHKEYKIFKDFMKTQSTFLRQYIEMSQASIRNCQENKQFLHYKASVDQALNKQNKFLQSVIQIYKLLSTQYTILKVQGKSFYRVHEESTHILKRCQETYKEQKNKAIHTDKKLQKVQQAQQNFYPAKDMNKTIMSTQYEQQYSRLNEEFQLCKQQLEECENACKQKILLQCKAIDEQIKKGKELIKDCYDQDKENQDDSQVSQINSKIRTKYSKPKRYTSPRFADLASHQFPVCQSYCQSQASFSNQDMKSYAKSEQKSQKSQKTLESQLLQSQQSKVNKRFDGKQSSSINDRLDFSLQEQQMLREQSSEIRKQGKSNESSQSEYKQ